MSDKANVASLDNNAIYHEVSPNIVSIFCKNPIIYTLFKNKNEHYQKLTPTKL